MYLYSDDAVDYAHSNNNSLRDYYGVRDIDNILIDIDKEQNTDDYTLRKCQGIVYALENDFELQSHNFRVYFSGSGYHIIIPNSVFNFSSNQKLPFQVKETMLKMFPDIDPMVYMRTGLYRVAHTINPKTNLYKIPLTRNEVMSLKWEEIHELAKTPRLEFPYEELVGDGELELYKVESIKITRQMGKVMEPKKVATCIQTMYNDGPQEGSRHTTLLRIVSHFRRHGVPSSAAKAALLDWNNSSLNEQEITNQVEYAYNK